MRLLSWDAGIESSKSKSDHGLYIPRRVDGLSRAFERCVADISTSGYGRFLDTGPELQVSRSLTTSFAFYMYKMGGSSVSEMLAKQYNFRGYASSRGWRRKAKNEFGYSPVSLGREKATPGLSFGYKNIHFMSIHISCVTLFQVSDVCYVVYGNGIYPMLRTTGPTLLLSHSPNVMLQAVKCISF